MIETQHASMFVLTSSSVILQPIQNSKVPNQITVFYQKPNWTDTAVLGGNRIKRQKSILQTPGPEKATTAVTVRCSHYQVLAYTAGSAHTDTGQTISKWQNSDRQPGFHMKKLSQHKNRQTHRKTNKCMKKQERLICCNVALEPNHISHTNPYSLDMDLNYEDLHSQTSSQIQA